MNFNKKPLDKINIKRFCQLKNRWFLFSHLYNFYYFSVFHNYLFGYTTLFWNCSMGGYDNILSI